METVSTRSIPASEAASPARGRRSVAKVVTAAVVATLAVLGAQETAFAETGTQRFHSTYAGPFSFADPPERTVIAVGPIQGKATERGISERPGLEPGTFVAMTELVFPDGSVFMTLTARGEMRFNERACIAFNRASGTWVITGGTGAYTGATGQGTFESRNILSGERTPEGCPAQPDRLISNLRFVGTVTVPDDGAA